MQKGGGDADDGLNPPPHPTVEGAGENTTSTPRPPDAGTTAHVLGPGTGGVSQLQANPVPPVVLGGAIQTVGTAPNVVCPQTGVIGGRTLPQQTGGVGYGASSDPVLLPSNTSISASGGTIHHHGQSPTRGGLPPLASPSQTIGGVSSSGGVTHAQRHREVTMTATTTPQTTTPPLSRNLFEGLTKSLAASAALGPSPRKKARIEEKPAATPEIAQQRKIIIDSKYKDMGKIRTAYIENLTEFFFLQNGGNIMDYISWKKRPTPQLVHFLKSGNLDSDEEEDHLVTVKTYNDEVKVWTGAGSNVPLSTPVAISKTLPPNVSALTQGSSVGVSQGQSASTHPKHLVSSASDSSGLTTPTMTVSVPSSLSITTTTASTLSGQPSVSVAKSTTSPLTPAANLHSQLAKCIAGLNTSQFKSALTTSISNGTQKSRFPLSKSQKISSVCTGPLGSQEAIVERAKQEAQVMQRVSELRKEGMWSSRRLPKVQEPPRNKAHWDYLLEEMQWLAADFAQERKWKKAGARKIARMVAKYHQELHQKEVRAEKEEAMRLRKIASQLAKQMREFWTNIEKVVQYKQQSRLEEKRKKALDLHLNFIVDQTEKYSTWLTEGLTGSTAGSVSSEPTNDQAINSGDEDFQPAQDDSDDEETIDKEEQEFGTDDASTQEEVAALQKESEVPIEELIRTIPKEVFSKPASLVDDEDQDVDIEGDGDSESGAKDQEFKGQGEDEEDMEDTIEEQEKHEKGNKQKEMDELKAEGEMSLEELAEKYAGAYDSDFEFPDDSTDAETDIEESEEESQEEELTEEEEEEEEELEEETTTEDVGLEYLMNAENKNIPEEPVKKEAETEGPGKEITDIAAEALSLQPKGYTLQTTEVKTKVPFLIKHKLREYQHVGLNWLATMYEKRLNGILADEMGLGKTIQTIALLAHLACEKGVWGPHLVVVPTSVMLNWEMEIKKWCPAFKILTYYGNQKERKLKRQGWTKTNAFHICITSYKLVIQDHQSFRRKKWKYFILDEAQNIKNFKSQRWQTLLNFSSQRRLLLTGTPLQNSLMELWSLMHFLMPHVFQSHKEFKEWFSNPLSGMIEGSHEYNDSLVRRLHKVLRPFLLRRLKDDVEKQMPKKYEHVVMCKLSKRQRYLYDDFMAQTKTKETLSSGHFMSVINILMQLRKVCNHPNLFDPRPIVSPFQMEGIVYHTPSSVLQALDYNPHQMVDLKTLYPSLVDMELDLAAFVTRRVKKLQTNRQLIMEIDDQPDPPPRLKPAKKPIVFRSVSPMLQSGSGRSSPVTAVSQSVITPGRAASPITIVRTAANVLRSPSPVPMKLAVAPTPLQLQRLTAPPVATAVVQPVTPSTMVLSSQPMATRLPTTLTGLPSKLPTLQGSLMNSTGSSPIVPSQPITVQIQQTEQGTQLMIPSGQLSQLPAGFIQIVQTSTGQQLITTASPLTSIQPAVSGTHLIQAVCSSPVIQATPTTPVHTINTGPQIIQAATVTPVQSSMIPSPVVQTASVTPVQNALSNTPIVHLASNAIQSSSVTPIIPASSVTPVQSVLSNLPVAPTTTQPIVLSTRSSLASVQSVLQQSMSGVSTPQSLVNGVPASTVNLSTSSPLNASPVISTPLTATPSTTTPVRLTGTVIQVSSSPTRGVISAPKPVMRVSPLSVDSSKLKLSTGTTVTTTNVTSKPTASITSVPRVVKAAPVKAVRPPKPKSEFHWAALESRLLKKRQEKLELLCKLNKRHCDVNLLYGQDVCNCVDLHLNIDCNKPVCEDWTGGYVHCYNSQHCKNPHRTEQYFNQTETLSNIVHTPDQYLTELKDILKRYVFVTPVAVAPCIQVQAAHPSPSYLVGERQKKVQLHQELSPRMDCLHSITANMTVTFPELRLIQYDCGKLQTLDILLRDLKSGDHRALIFTQMTKMLDVLECFLNYHGHRYLRLDGTTKVEQRQALMDRFNADRRIFCFILSTRSGGLGVNLTGADTVIFYDSDWNPTMDAQAQDRCHRIGQTRDVHIYRLISQKTIEENILKKANQKRLLGDLAIEGGNFTTAFFKEQTLKDLFDEPSGLDQLAKEKAATQERKEAKAAALAGVQLPGSEGEATKTIVAKFEEALCKAEDESDVLAANQVRAEQKAELAEFDENIPWDEKDEKKLDDDVSKVEQELAMLEKELSPVERYAVFYIESQMEPYNAEELEIAEEEVELAKNSWELNRLKSLKEEEERRAEWEEDEMLFTYSRDHNQVYVGDTDVDHMPMWAPPTPPQDDNDMYIDQTLYFMYEPVPMTETQLPPIYVKKEMRKPKVETMSRRLLQKQANSEAASQLQARKLKQRKEEAPRVPHSLFERPTASVLKLRKELKLQKLKQGLIRPFRPVPSSSSSSSNKPVMDISQDHPEWLIHEDWALLQAVQTLLDLPLNLMIVTPAHIPNWDLVSDVVNSCSRVYRSPKQCKVRYGTVIIPREEGRILYDINPRKQKKSKGIYKDLPVVSSSYSSTQTKNNRPMKTSQLYLQDSHNSVSLLHSLRFDSVKCIAQKRTPTLRPMLVNPTQKNPKHAAVLAESGITYDTPLNPEKVAAIRAERIQQEKKKGQVLMLKAQSDQLAAQQRSQAAQQAQSQTGQTSTVVAAAQVASQLQTAGTATATILQAGTLQKAVTLSPATIPAVSIARPVGSTSNIIVNTAPGVSGSTFAAINKRMSQQTAGMASTVKTLSPQTVGQAVRAQPTVRGALTMQELTTAVNQVRANIATGKGASVVTTTNLAAAQLHVSAQRTIAGATAVTGVTSVQQQLSKPLTQAQLSQLQRQQQQQQTILKQSALPQRQILSQKIPIHELRRQQQQLKQQQLKQQLQSQAGATAHQLHVTTGQKPVLASQLVTTIGQKNPVKAIPRLTEAEVQALFKQQQQVTAAGRVQQVNIIAPVQQVGQTSSAQTPVATLVKTVSTPGVSSVTIPVSQVGPVNINVSMPGQKVSAAKNQTVSQLQQQQHRINNFRLLQRNFNQGKIGVGQVQQATGKGQVLINRPLQTMTIQQFVKQQQQNQATIQQIITSVAPTTHTSQPTIIATVTQAQPMIAKVSLATAPATSQVMHTITQPSSLTLGSQVSVTTQPSVATLSLTAASPHSTSQTGAVHQPVSVSSAVSAATVHMQPIQTVSVAPAKLTSIPQGMAQSQIIQQVPSGQVVVSAVGRQHSVTPQPPVIAAHQVVVTATPDSPQLQGQIHRTIAHPTAPTTLLTGQGTMVTASPRTVSQITAASFTSVVQGTPAQSLAPSIVQPTSTVPQVTVATVSTPPQTTMQAVVSPAVPQTTAQQTQAQQTPAKTAHYAMRSRQPPKH